MLGSVFLETLRRNWRTALYWGVGIAFYAVIALLILPNQEALRQYVGLISTLPSGIMAAFGLEDAAVIGTPEGFLGYSYFLYIVLVVTVYAILAGLNVTANEEDSGVMDMVLSLPLNRWQVIIETFAAYALLLLLIILIGFVGLVLGRSLNVNAEPVTINTLLTSSLNMFPSALLVLAFTTLVSVIVRRRSTAAAFAGGFVIASYLLNALGAMVNNSVTDALSNVSFFKHYDAMSVLLAGVTWSTVIGMIAIALLMTAGAVALFQRRDIAV
jgi:ABC-2 type transport system permease protein